MTTPSQDYLAAKAERITVGLRARGAEYLYDGVYVYHDGIQYWLCTATGDRIALEPRTLELFSAYVKRHEAGRRA